MVCDGKHVHENAYGKNKAGTFRTRRLQAYFPGLCRMLALSVVKTASSLLKTGRGPRGWLRTGRERLRRSQWTVEGQSSGLYVMKEQY